MADNSCIFYFTDINDPKYHYMIFDLKRFRFHIDIEGEDQIIVRGFQVYYFGVKYYDGFYTKRELNNISPFFKKFSTNEETQAGLMKELKSQHFELDYSDDDNNLKLNFKINEGSNEMKFVLTLEIDRECL